MTTWKSWQTFSMSHAPRERVSWNVLIILQVFANFSHAPRERVSWNLCLFSILPPTPVTLHVSVWVEMYKSVGRKRRYSSRSTWACELKFYIKKNLKWRWWSRSTWACELKLEICEKAAKILGHAPRERVSWNEVAVKHHISVCSHAPRERVSWNRFISPRQ